MSRTKPITIYAHNLYGPGEEIEVVGEVTKTEYTLLRLLEGINDALQDIAATLQLNREDRLLKEREEAMGHGAD